MLPGKDSPSNASDLGKILVALVVLILTVYSCPRYLLLLSYKVDKTM